MVKVIVWIVVVLSVCSKPTAAWLRGGRKSKTSVDVGVEARKHGGTRVSGGVSHKGKGWSAEIKGNVDSKRNWGAEARVSIKFGKRSIDWNGRHFSVRLDPCEFAVYDGNKDGVIVKSEMQATFGENIKADELFEALDITTGDGGIDKEEFYFMLPETIKECQDMEKLRPY